LSQPQEAGNSIAGSLAPQRLSTSAVKFYVPVEQPTPKSAEYWTLPAKRDGRELSCLARANSSWQRQWRPHAGVFLYPPTIKKFKKFGGKSMTEQQQNEPENLNLEVIDTAPIAQRPRPDVACADCLNSIWFRSEQDLSCFCKQMHALTWGSLSKTSEILACGGRM
jgi:hypothetical protein